MLQAEPQEPKQYLEEDMNLSIMSHLTRVSPKVWKDLPRNVQEVINEDMNGGKQGKGY